MAETIQIAVFIQGDVNINTGPRNLLPDQETMLDVYRHRTVPSWAPNGGKPVADLLPYDTCVALESIPANGRVILTERQKQALNAAHWTEFPNNPGNTGC